MAELQPDDVERLCESGGMRMGFVPAGSLSLSRGDSLSKAGSAADGGGADNDDDVLADGGMDEREASAMREKFNKLFETCCCLGRGRALRCRALVSVVGVGRVASYCVPRPWRRVSVCQWFRKGGRGRCRRCVFFSFME